MKFEFNDKSYIDMQLAAKPDTVFVSVAARSEENKSKIIINSVELSLENFKKLVSEILPDLNTSVAETVEVKPKKKQTKKKTTPKAKSVEPVAPVVLDNDKGETL